MTDWHFAAIATFWVALFTYSLGALSAAPWVRTRRELRDALAAALPLRPGARVYDIGCGDGAVLFTLARANPGIAAVGYEISLVPFILGTFARWRGGRALRGVTLKYRDFFGQSLADADVVFAFLLPGAYPRLVPKLAAELRDDAILAIEGWQIPGIDPEAVIGKTATSIGAFVYRGRALRKTKAGP